jgi:hypothetical protein
MRKIHEPKELDDSGTICFVLVSSVHQSTELLRAVGLDQYSGRSGCR